MVIPGHTLLLDKAAVGVRRMSGQELAAKGFGFPNSRGRSTNHPEAKPRLLPVSKE